MVSVFNVRLDDKTIKFLRWYIHNHNILSNAGKLVSIPSSLESMAKSFVDDVVVPEFNALPIAKQDEVIMFYGLGDVLSPVEEEPRPSAVFDDSLAVVVTEHEAVSPDPVVVPQEASTPTPQLDSEDLDIYHQATTVCEDDSSEDGQGGGI